MWSITFVIFVSFQLTLPVYGQSKSIDGRWPQKHQQEGVAVEFDVQPLATNKGHKLVEGADAIVRFKITDANTGKSLNSLRPAVWIDQRTPGEQTDSRACREKVQSFLQPGFNRRATIDLNSYFILTLNDEANISVIDPLSGFGGSKLYTLVALPAPGEDWVMSADHKRLYVSMPQLNQVALVDLTTWKVIALINDVANASRLALQNDGKYLWVSNEAQANSGITVIDTGALKIVAHINTGQGPHELAFTPDDRYAFVTNKLSGTLSSIDVRKLAVVKEIKIGLLPTSLAYSALSQAVYVVNEGDGTVAAIGSAQFATLTEIKTAPGSNKVRISPDGRFAFAVNPKTDAVYIIDLSTNRLVHTVPVDSKPDQISFTPEFAYVRSAATEFVSLINLARLRQEQSEVAVARFPAGQKAPQDSSWVSLAEAMIPGPEPGAMLVANPTDKMIYFYMEGMAAPMGNFQNYRRAPRGILLLNNSLKETTPGVYATNVRLTEAGSYDVAFLLDVPRVVKCFSLEIEASGSSARMPAVSIKTAVLPSASQLRVGKDFRLRFKVTESESGRSVSNLTDMTVLVFLAPGIWQHRQLSRAVGDGVYEMTFTPPQAGIYYVFFQCPSLNVTFSQLPSVTLTAIEADAPPSTNQ
ncbi:MAG TPA: beta-propeller fold lactonase family protein [Pyrinomonadaceae bacterium]|nr:beta-propeller fold lactonase family protein [Pyrinomonadaceae bacterium]